MNVYRSQTNWRLLSAALCCWVAFPAMAGTVETKGKLYVVGMGPAGSDLTAPRVLSIVRDADYLLCSPGLPKRFDRFAEVIDPGKVAFNPWEDIRYRTGSAAARSAFSKRRSQ